MAFCQLMPEVLQARIGYTGAVHSSVPACLPKLYRLALASNKGND